MKNLMTLSTTPRMNNLYYDLGPDVVAFSTRRQGGMSQGNYASLNVNPFCGDNSQHVTANRTLLANELGIPPSHIVLPHQVHGTRTIRAYGACAPEGVDAIFTTEPGLCVAVSTADCIPVLLHDPVHGAVAAIHAGWRGTVAGIVSETLQQMVRELGTEPSHIRAVIGSGVGLEAFEVGDEVYDAFASAGFPMEQLAMRRGKWHICLPEANTWLLREQGVKDIRLCGICTYSHPEEFFSARRLGIHSGRILNGIMIKEKRG